MTGIFFNSNKRIKMKYTILSSILSLFILTGCFLNKGKQIKTTAVTDKNYALAETQVIFTKYVKQIAAATKTNGVGVFLRNKKGADPKKHTVMRVNFDTLYTYAIVDFKRRPYFNYA